MDIFIGILIGLFVLMVLVIVHEFGHFLMARRNGVNVLEFGIGFPPRAIAWIKDEKTGKWRRFKKSEWGKDKALRVVYSEAKKGYAEKGLAQKGMIFSLNWLPIGGFCQMDGESAEDSRKGTFGSASFWAKTKILFAGVAMNWLVAFLIFTVLAWTGMPNFIDNQFTIADDTKEEFTPVVIDLIAENSPAEQAGLEVGDYILSINNEKVEEESDVTNINKTHAGEEVVYTITKQKTGETIDVAVTLNEEDAEYLLGVIMSREKTSYSTWSAPIVGAGLTAQLTGETFKGVGMMLWNLLTGVGSQLSPDESVREDGQETLSSVGDQVSGPIGIIGSLFPAVASKGPAFIAFFTAVISISLACMNVLPIPALDGGRWLLIAIYKLRRKKLTKKTEEKVVSVAFMILLMLIFIVTILDIIRITK